MLERQPNPHVSFGFDIHFCLVAPLAWIEAKLALSKLLASFSKIEHVKLDPIQSPFVFRVKCLPIRLSL
jgi:cytochrome P450 family 109